MADNTVSTQLSIEFKGEGEVKKHNKSVESAQKTVTTATKSITKDFVSLDKAAKTPLEKLSAATESAFANMGGDATMLEKELKKLGDALTDAVDAGATDAEIQKAEDAYRDLGKELKKAAEATDQLAKAQSNLQEERAAAPWAEDVAQKEKEEQEKQLAQQKDFSERLVGEVMKVGMLSGKLYMRVARAAQGPFLAIAAGVWIAEKALKAARKAIDATAKSIDELVRSSTATRAFESMGAAAGIAFEGVARRAREASGYTIELYEATTMGNRLMSAGYDDVAESIDDLAQLAKVMGDALGVDATAQLQSLVDAIKSADAETLELEYGFEGVTGALLDEAQAAGVLVDDLDDTTKASVALRTILPQVKDKLEELGGVSVIAGANLSGFLSETKKAADSILASLGTGILGAFDLGPDFVSAWTDFNVALTVARDTLVLFQKQAEQGLLDPDDVREAQEAYDEFSSEMKKRILEGGVDTEDMTRELANLGDEMWRIDRIARGLPSWLSLAEQAIGAAAGSSKDFTKELDKAKGIAADFELDWTVDLAEFMPLETAAAAAKELADEYREKMAKVIDDTGSSVSIEGQVLTAEFERRFSEMLANVSLNTLAVIRTAGAELISTAYRAYLSYTGDVRGTAEDLAMRLLPDASFEDVAARADKIEEQLLKGVGVPFGGELDFKQRFD